MNSAAVAARIPVAECPSSPVPATTPITRPDGVAGEYARTDYYAVSGVNAAAYQAAWGVAPGDASGVFGGQVNGALSGSWETRSQQIVQVVAGPQAAAVHPLSVGSTYVVYTQAALRDSVRVDVRQDIAHLTIDPPSCEAGVRATLHPAETLQLSARAPAYDANRSIVTDTALVRAALQTVLWSVQGPLSLAVSSSGLVTALAPGQGWVFGSIYRDGGWIEVMGCPVEVL